jgi:DNA-3-methyladenine glycosylase II
MWHSHCNRPLPDVHIFSFSDFHSLCDQLAARDPDLDFIIQQYGYPPVWRRPNTFESLIHIILEQQVSLASALAALNKLRRKVKKITPSNILKLTDRDLKDCYFSRQKTVYIRSLAEALKSRRLNLKSLVSLPDDEIRKQLTAIKGIGDWSVDIYLIFVLQNHIFSSICLFMILTGLLMAGWNSKNLFRGR